MGVTANNFIRNLIQNFCQIKQVLIFGHLSIKKQMKEMRKEEAKEKLKIARQISKELENNLVKRCSKDRLKMRKITNERLGIYTEISYFIVD